MSRWRPDLSSGTTVLGCDAALLAGPAASVAAPDGGWHAAALQQGLETVAAGPALQVRVGPDLCRHFVMEAAAGLRSLAELRELAALRAAQLFGGATEGWAVVADWRLDGPFACAALPQPLLQALRQAAGRRRLGVVSSLLLAVQGLLDGPARSGFVGFATPRHAVLLGLRGGRLASLHAARRAGSDDAEALTDQLQRGATREALLGGAATDATVALAWPGPGALPPGAWDAAGRLPVPRADDTEAAWAQRLGRAG